MDCKVHSMAFHFLNQKLMNAWQVVNFTSLCCTNVDVHENRPIRLVSCEDIQYSGEVFAINVTNRRRLNKSTLYCLLLRCLVDTE